MQYEILPVTQDDAPAMIAVRNKAFTTNLLEHLLFPADKAHLTPRDELLAWQIERQRHRLVGKDAALYFKAVHAETGQLAGYAGWWAPHHFGDMFPSTSDGAQQSTAQLASTADPAALHDIPEPKPDVEAKKDELPACMNVDLYKAFMTAVDKKREELWGKDSNYWYLGALSVDPSHQRKGLASKLLQTGFRLADEAGVPIYLEATEEGAPMYLRNGFESKSFVEMEGCEYRVEAMIRPAKARN